MPSKHFTMNSKDQPIGYWLKKADELLTKGINDIQCKNGLNRTSWQTLNIISQEEDISQAELNAKMKPFANANDIESIIKNFDQREMLESLFPLNLSLKGKKVYSECLDQQKEFRQQCMQGINEEDYRITMATLQKLVTNLQG